MSGLVWNWRVRGVVWECLSVFLVRKLSIFFLQLLTKQLALTQISLPFLFKISHVLKIINNQQKYFSPPKQGNFTKLQELFTINICYLVCDLPAKSSEILQFILQMSWSLQNKMRVTGWRKFSHLITNIEFLLYEHRGGAAGGNREYLKQQLPTFIVRLMTGSRA